MHGYVLTQRVAEGGAGDRETQSEGRDREGATCLPTLCQPRSKAGPESLSGETGSLWTHLSPKQKLPRLDLGVARTGRGQLPSDRSHLCRAQETTTLNQEDHSSQGVSTEAGTGSSGSLGSCPWSREGLPWLGCQPTTTWRTGSRMKNTP